MTITGTSLFTDAARMIGVIASGESLNTDEAADGLIVLNKLVDSWSAEQIPLPQLTLQSVSLSGATATLTRPLKIKAAAAVNGNFSQPVEIASAERWAEIVDHARSGGFPDRLYCDYAYPTSNIYAWPSATCTLQLHCYMPLTVFATAGTSIDLPPGYARGLTMNLALDLAELFGRPVTQSLFSSAQAAKQGIIATNARIFGDLVPPSAPKTNIPQAQEQAA
jgi:hypothetical protein